MKTELGRQLQQMMKDAPERDVANQAQAPTEIDDTQRMVIQNFFDTQPKRRQEYLRKLGWEMNPEDDNQIRPLADPSAEWDEIDPSPNFMTVLTPGKWAEGAKELVRDAGDIAFDVFAATPLIAGGAVKGATVAGAPFVATPPALPVAVVLGGMAGGALGNTAAEGVKFAVQELLTDPNVPVDQGLLVTQSIMTGALGEIFRVGAKASTPLIKRFSLSRLKGKIRAVKNAMREAGGFDQKIVNDAIKNPERYTDDAIKGAFDRLRKQTREIVGAGEGEVVKTSRNIPRDSVLGRIANVWNKKADEAIDILSSARGANFKLFTGMHGEQGGIIDTLMGISKQIEAKPMALRTKDERHALKYLHKQILELAESYAPKSIVKAKGKPPRVNFDILSREARELTFKEGRDFLKKVQKDAWESEIPGHIFIKQAIGGGEDGLRKMADAKAARVVEIFRKNGNSELADKVDLPTINANRSKVLGVYNNLKGILKPDTLMRAYKGVETDTKRSIQEGLASIDRLAGDANKFIPKGSNKIKTNFNEMIETGAMQKAVNDIFEKGTSQGAMGSLTAGVKGAAKKMPVTAGGAFAASVPFGLGTQGAKAGAAYGAITGFKEGMLAGNPRIALNNIRKFAGQLKGKVSPEEFTTFLEKELNMTFGERMKSGIAGALSDVGEAVVKGRTKDATTKQMAIEGIKSLPTSFAGQQAATGTLSPGDTSDVVARDAEALLEGGSSVNAGTPTAGAAEVFQPKTDLGRKLQEMMSQSQ